MLHGLCMIYKDGIPQSLQLFEDGELIKDNIISISVAHNSHLPDDENGRYDIVTNRKLITGFIMDNKILEGSFGEYTYVYSGITYTD